IKYFLPTDVQTQFVDLGGNGSGIFKFGEPLHGIGTTTWTFPAPTVNISPVQYADSVGVVIDGHKLGQVVAAITTVAETFVGINVAGLTSTLEQYLANPLYFSGGSSSIVPLASDQFIKARTAAANDTSFIGNIVNDAMTTDEQIYKSVFSITVIPDNAPV